MKYYYNLYLDDYTSNNREEIIEKLESDKWQFEIYLITMSKNEKNHLEIYNSALLLQKGMADEQLFVIGFARGYDEAVELVEMIIKEVYDNTNGTNIRNYILQKQQKFEEGNA